MKSMSAEDTVLDRLWRDRFFQPLPLRGAAWIVIDILVKSGLQREAIEQAIEAETLRRSTDGSTPADSSPSNPSD